MTRAEFITEMLVQRWSMEDIQEQIDLHDRMENVGGHKLPYDAFFIVNTALHMRTYHIRKDGHVVDIEGDCIAQMNGV